MENNYAIETNNLSIHYGSFTAVKDVNLQIERQKITTADSARWTQRPASPFDFRKIR